MSAGKAKSTLLMVDIPRDELAFCIAQACLGMRAPAGTSATKALDDMNRVTQPDPRAAPTGTQFRSAADAAVIYFHERINAARQPS